jgi:asparagine synthetase B (glutamine-hydrolysing)
MCGIYGILNFDWPEQPMDSIFAAMGGVIAHRGPEDFARYRDRSADRVRTGNHKNWQSVSSNALKNIFKY